MESFVVETKATFCGVKLILLHNLVAGILLIGFSFTTAAFGQSADDTDILQADNLVAWCIVPFDANKRSPAERAVMLEELGIKRCAYDWREEHVPTFEQEIIEYQKHGIEYFAFWSVHEDAFRLFDKYDLHPQIWQTVGEPDGSTQTEKIEAAAQQMLPLAKRTGEMKCKLGLYNHGGWGGEPENMVAICRRLRELGQEHVGIVYNFHHGHGHLDDWAESFELMKSYLLCLNLNGMNPDAEPKILGIGQGAHELEMIRTVINAGYDGPIGILDHREQLDAKESLEENLDGLNLIREELRHDRNWLQFRGPGGAGKYLARDSYSSDLNRDDSLMWKVAVPEGHSSPIVVDDVIILTGYDGLQLIVLALDRHDGATKWRRTIDVEAIEKVYHHGPATPTAVSDGSNVFVVFGSFGVLSYDLQGNELWRKEWPLAENLYGTAASPILVDEKLIVLGSDQKQGMLRAYDKNDGSLIWERVSTGPNSSWATPVVLRPPDLNLALIYEPFNLRAINLASGTEVWSVPGLADEPITVPQVIGDTVVVTSYNMRTNHEVIGVPKFEEILKQCDANKDRQLERAETEANGSVLSRPDADGEGDHPLRIFFRMLDENRDGIVSETEWPRMQGWIDTFKHANGFLALKLGESSQAPELLWQQENAVPECPTPVCSDDILFAVRNGGVLTCLDTKTGEPVFQDRILPGGPYYSSPVMGDGKIWFASARGEVSVVTAAATPQLLSSVDLEEPVWATPALASGTVFVRSKSTLWAFGEKALEERAVQD